MWTTKLTISATFLVATVAVTDGHLLAQQSTAPKTASPVRGTAAQSKPDSAEMAQIEAKLAKLRELIRPQPGEYAMNIARIAWERDPWQAAIKAGKEGKSVIAYGVHSVGVTCGYG